MDWNNDGMQDLLIGDSAGNVIIYKNTNDNSNPVLDGGTTILNTGDDRATPSMTDWDGDGKKDLLVGTYIGNVQIYKNTGTKEAPSFGSYSNLLVDGNNFDLTASPDRSSPRVYDFNGDGLKDVLVGELTGNVYYLINTGTIDSNSFPVFNSAEKLLLADGNGTALRYINNPASGAPRSRIDIVDWNNDGLPDIVSGGNDGRVMLFTAAPEPMSTTLFLVGSGVLGLSMLRKKFIDRN